MNSKFLVVLGSADRNFLIIYFQDVLKNTLNTPPQGSTLRNLCNKLRNTL